MKGYTALLRLQLISRFAELKPKNIRASMQGKKSRTAFRALGFAVLIIYMGAMLFILEKKMLDVLIQIGTPDLMVSMAVTLTMMGTLIMSFFYIMSSLYLGRDAGFLASLPLEPRTVLCAKLTEIWVSESLISAAILLPACIQYGIRTGAEAGFYLRLIPVWLLADVIPVALVTLISTLLIRLTALWRHREMLSTVFGVIFLVLYMLVMANVGGMTGDSATGGEMIQKFMAGYGGRIDLITRAFPPARWAARGLMGEWPMLGLYAGSCALAAGLAVALVSPVYRKLSLLQTETPASGARKRAKQEEHKVSSPFWASCRREIRSILRTPSYATNILPISFMPLFMVLVMYFIMGNALQEEGETVRQVFSAIDGPLVTAILTAVMAYMGGMNPALSTAVTREGKGHAMMMSLPVSGWTIVRSKFAVGFGLAAAGVILGGIAMMVLLPMAWVSILFAIVLCLLFALGSSCLALARDIKKPKLDWMTEQQAVKQNFGVMVSMLQSWGILIALAGVTWFLISRGIGNLAYFGIMAGILLILDLLAWRLLKKTAGRYYCQG